MQEHGLESKSTTVGYLHTQPKGRMAGGSWEVQSLMSRNLASARPCMHLLRPPQLSGAVGFPLGLNMRAALASKTEKTPLLIPEYIGTAVELSRGAASPTMSL